ncbi:glycine/betaine ABC transporter substrate-binding protein [Cypionkella aquatica]|uniref:Glycine/betaine ABC transporter substrate-binding protein n=1 Tax=Cypionkella aquatica TaxID=1756042 RepID=A0AA37TV51_9RHOB|nr:choline ABC transporter substrate-binding protein [Cypionkella aquatica]GLS86273.1 glycine/betaine ABC transporter substrate-binding protein [Cypionkella aquatica]
MRKVLAGVLMTAMAVGAAQAAEPEACKAVRISDLGWTDIGLTNATAEVILDALGYDATQTLLSLDVTFVSMERGDIDVFQGNWRPFQDVQYAKFFDDGIVERLGMNLEGAKYTLAVPKYVADAGIKSFDDLAAHGDQFGKKIYAIEPGSNQPLLDMVAANAHGLGDWTIVESSEAGMLAQVERAVSAKEWVVFLGWQPHPMNVVQQIGYLADGDAEFGPNFGGASVYTIARRDYAKTCPNVGKFFSQLAFNIDYENAGMQMIMGEGMEFPAAGTAMMAKHPDMLEAWLKDVTTFDGQPGLPAVKAALGL